MSDIKRPVKKKNDGAAIKALAWIEKHIHDNALGKGDALPHEVQIAQAAKVGRSSVREALTALKVLGMIRSRRKSGIRIVRDPVLLELRHYFSIEPTEPEKQADTMEFRAALEWGLGALMLERATKGTVAGLRSILSAFSASDRPWDKMLETEIRFHTALTVSCGNRLVELFAHLYEPIFRIRKGANHTPSEVTKWLNQHEAMVDALEHRNQRNFMSALRAHTHGYMRRNYRP